jgi:hypothetical protein
MRVLTEELRDRDIDLLDGIKVRDERGWAQVLPDPDEPLIHIYAEGETEEASEELEAELERLRKRMEAMARELERARRTASERVRSREITDIIPLSAIRRFPWEVGS